MTLTEATTEATRRNGIQGTDTIIWCVFPYWLPTFVKTYGVALIPSKYVGDFDTSNDSQKIAFQRVSIQAFPKQPTATQDDFVTAFDSAAVKDVEMKAHLGL